MLHMNHNNSFENGRLLFFADIHIDDYPAYNLRGPHSRLKQYIDFANCIDEIAIKQNAGTIILGGDTLNKGVNDPDIEHVLKEFLRIISNDGNRQVLHVLGQHDIKRKEQNLKYSASTMNLFPEYTTYLGNGVVWTYCNPLGKFYTAAFRDWVPSEEADTSFWPDDKIVDFFFAHVTNNPPFGQKINNKKFRVGLFGDIHQQGEFENMINLGTPFYQHRLDEEQNGRYAFIDLNENYDDPRDAITFLPIDPTGKQFFKLKVVNEELPEGKEYDNDSNTYFMFIPKLTINTEDSQISFSAQDQLKLSNDGIKQLIEDKFKGTELENIHKVVLSNLTETPVPIDLNFQIMSLDILNYRSIKKYHYDFGKVTAILGDHGSGKSTFINAIKLALTLGKISEKNISHGETYAEINLKIAYQDHIYTLCSTSGTPAIAIDGEWQEIHAKERLGLAKSRMPFLNYIDLFMFAAEDRALLSSMNDDRKSDIISKMYNIDILNYLHDKAVELNYAKKESLKTLTQQRFGLESVIASHRTLIPPTYAEKSISEITAEVNAQEARLKALTEGASLVNQYKTLKEVNATKQKELDDLTNEYNAIKKSIEDRKEQKLENQTLLSEANSELDKLKRQKELRAQVAKEEKELLDLYNKISGLTILRDKELAAQSDKCPTCGAKLSDEIIQNVKNSITQKYQTRYEEESKVYADRYAEYTSRKSQIVDIENEEEIRVKYENQAKMANYFLSKLQFDEESVPKLEIQIASKSAGIDSAKETELYNKIVEKGLDLNTDTSDQIKSLSESVANLKKIQESVQLIIDKLKEVTELNSKIQILESEQTLYQKYIESCSNTSPLYQSILQLIASKFSNEQYKLVVTSYQYRGSMRISIQMNYLVDKIWFEYPELSTAQKCFCDIYFLSNLLKGSGALILDEYFANVNSSAMIGMMETLKHLNVRNLILSSHHDGLVVDGDVLKFELQNNESNIIKL